MRLDQFLKALTPYTEVEIIILSKDLMKSISGYKISVIQELIEDGINNFDDYEIYSINLVKAFSIDEDGDDSRSTAHLQIIAKEDY